MAEIMKHKVRGLPMMLDHGKTDFSEDNHPLRRFKGKSFIVQEKYGISLKDIMYEQKIRINNVDLFKIGVQLLKIVEQLHKSGYVHLDIKPDNILIGSVDEYMPERDTIVEDQCHLFVE
mmetsp:Transcript_3748/g.5670  ORF Transcript_3748/g.5670 Transcript_3748/m.5670 type:complete len:119 (-) Transcript_3748:610-966(-)